MTTSRGQRWQAANTAPAWRVEPNDVAVMEESREKSNVAALAGDQIDGMDQEELVRVIRVAHMSLIRPNVNERLGLYGRDTLRRLAYLARRCCRNQGY
jgi:hypothetical protein